MRFSLRTLLILMLLAGPLGALGWKEWLAYRERVAEARAKELERQAILLQVNRRVQLMWTSSSPNFTPLESPTERQIWEERKAVLQWESFPESQPNSR